MGRRRLEVGEHGQIKVTALGGRRYRARCEVRCRDGKVRSVQADGPSKLAATDAVKLRATERAENCGRPMPGGGVAALTPVTTVAVLADKWWEQKQQSGISDQTITHYEPYHLLIKKGLGELRIRDVTTATVEWFLDAEAADKPSKAANLRRQLTEMFAIAIRHDAYPGANPVREVTIVKAEKKDIRALTVDELTAYREHIRAWQAAPARPDGKRGGRPRAQGLLDYVNVQVATGARINEVLALRWQDVDLEAEQPTAFIGATLVPGPKDGPSIVRQEHRKAKDRFTVILPKFAVDTLLRMKVNAEPNPHDAIFPSARGTWKSAANLRTQLRSAHGKDWGWVQPHTFRKTVATVVARELGIDEAAAQLGNTPAVAAKHYVQRETVAPDLRSTLDKLAPTDSN
ncbi:tyrosine-type recombinase/integrase [Gordonia sp. PDNC005]|uniref:tyrosine-type recombinase/integrase n=1 Tax=Gordonia sp. PDNC005 TaxID=2811424 RepID=UPI0019666C30|nr:site-specific integrase [Gordonia sp. PDNC005]QRY62696.1 tyrosine-type recombinase/integrase [Gordonia sp. PDNC005]